MTIDAQILDQRVANVAKERRQRFSETFRIGKDEDRLRSLAFVFVVIKTTLDLGETETMECMVDGGADFGIDAIHVAAPRGGEFDVTLVQGKYKRRLDAAAAFP